jgi:hypothetical protein
MTKIIECSVIRIVVFSPAWFAPRILPVGFERPQSHYEHDAAQI